MNNMEFIEILIRTIDGKPYYEIHYTENGEHHIGYSSFDIKIVSAYLKEFFIKQNKDEVWRVLIRPINKGGCPVMHSYKTKREAVISYLKFTRDGTLTGTVIQDIGGTIINHTEAIEQLVAEN